MKKQTELNIYCGRNGGVRPGSGRPAKHSAGVRHRQRERVNEKLPLHINFKYRTTVRSEKLLKTLERSFENAFKFNLTVTHFSLQTNHVHLIAEAKNNESLSSGMRSITVTLTKALNKGHIQLERYHLHVLRTPSEVRNAVEYVTHNEHHHTGKSNNQYSGKMFYGNSWLIKSISSNKTCK